MGILFQFGFFRRDKRNELAQLMQQSESKSIGLCPAIEVMILNMKFCVENQRFSNFSIDTRMQNIKRYIKPGSETFGSYLIPNLS